MIFSRAGWFFLGAAVTTAGFILLKDENIQKELKKILKSGAKIYDSALENYEVAKEDVEDFVADTFANETGNSDKSIMDEKSVDQA